MYLKPSGIVPFYSRNGAIPSEPPSIKTPPYSYPSFFYPPRVSDVRELEQFLIRSPNRFFRFPTLSPGVVRSSPATTLSASVIRLPIARFLSSILGNRRAPLTGTSNQGFLRDQNSGPVQPCSLPSSCSFFAPLPTSLCPPTPS